MQKGMLVDFHIKGVAKIRQLAGEEWAMFLTSSCPQLVLAGKMISPKGSKRIGVQ